MSARMHDDEIDIDHNLVHRLLAAQFPQWAALKLERVRSEGTVNAIFRLGDHMAVRLPRIPRHQDPADTPSWLAALAPHLPLAIPEPIAVGEPDAGYPWTWSVLRWLDGERFDLERLEDRCATAAQFAEFIKALQHIDAKAMPCPPPPAPELRDADEAVRRAAEKARGLIDTDAFLKAWEDALLVPTWDREPVLVHRDLGPGNLLIRDGRLAAVIDWGALAVGDPALDVCYEGLFSGEARAVFRSVMPVDDDMSRRIRARGLWNVVSVAYYAETNPSMATQARQLIAELLRDS